MFGLKGFVVADVDFWSNQRIALVTRGSRRENMGFDVGKPVSVTRCWPEFKDRNTEQMPAWDGMASNDHYPSPHLPLKS